MEPENYAAPGPALPVANPKLAGKLAWARAPVTSSSLTEPRGALEMARTRFSDAAVKSKGISLIRMASVPDISYDTNSRAQEVARHGLSAVSRFAHYMEGTLNATSEAEFKACPTPTYEGVIFLRRYQKEVDTSQITKSLQQPEAVDASSTTANDLDSAPVDEHELVKTYFFGGLHSGSIPPGPRLIAVSLRKWERIEMNFISILQYMDKNWSGLVSERELILSLVIEPDIFLEVMHRRSSSRSVPHNMRLSRDDYSTFVKIFSRFFEDAGANEEKLLCVDSIKEIMDVKYIRDQEEADAFYSGLEFYSSLLRLSVEKKNGLLEMTVPLICLLFSVSHVAYSVFTFAFCVPLNSSPCGPFAWHVAVFEMVMYFFVNILLLLHVLRFAPFVRHAAFYFFPSTQIFPTLPLVIMNILGVGVGQILLMFASGGAEYDTADKASDHPQATGRRSGWAAMVLLNTETIVLCFVFLLYNVPDSMNLSVRGYMYILREEGRLCGLPVFVPFYWRRHADLVRGLQNTIIEAETKNETKSPGTQGPAARPEPPEQTDVNEVVYQAKWYNFSWWKDKTNKLLKEVFFNYNPKTNSDMFEPKADTAMYELIELAASKRREQNELVTAWDLLQNVKYVSISKYGYRGRKDNDIFSQSRWFWVGTGFAIAGFMCSFFPLIYHPTHITNVAIVYIVISAMIILPPSVMWATRKLETTTRHQFRRMIHALRQTSLLISVNDAISNCVPHLPLAAPQNVEAWFQIRQFVRHNMFREVVAKAEAVGGVVLIGMALSLIANIVYVYFILFDLYLQMHSAVIYVLSSVWISFFCLDILFGGESLLKCQSDQVRDLRQQLVNIGFMKSRLQMSREKEPDDSKAKQELELLDCMENITRVIETLENCDEPLVFLGIRLNSNAINLTRAFLFIFTVAVLARLGVSIS